MPPIKINTVCRCYYCWYWNWTVWPGMSPLGPWYWYNLTNRLSTSHITAIFSWSYYNLYNSLMKLKRLILYVCNCYPYCDLLFHREVANNVLPRLSVIHNDLKSCFLSLPLLLHIIILIYIVACLLCDCCYL